MPKQEQSPECLTWQRNAKVTNIIPPRIFLPLYFVPITYLCAMKFIIQILISTLAILVTAWLIGVKVDNVGTAIIVAAVLAFLNAVVRPVLIIFTIPITVVTLGLFLIVINALMVMLADKLIDGFSVGGFWKALVFSIVLWLVTAVFESIGRKDDKNNSRPKY